MKMLKIILGLICVLAGTLPPHVLYAMGEDGNLWNIKLFEMMVVAAVISFVTFAACRLVISGMIGRLLVGAIASYAALLIVLLVSAHMAGNLAETMMWLPIMLFFGIPSMAPLVVMSGVGSVLVFGDEEVEPEPANPPNVEPVARPPQG